MSNRARTVVLAAVMLTPVVGFAGSSSTDWTLGPGGAYSYSTGGSLTGLNIPILSVLGDSTPSNNGASLSIVDGLLNFTSGAFDGTSQTWSWAGGGVLNLTGCIAGVTTKGPCTGSNNVALVSDDFTSVSIVREAGALDAVFGNVAGDLNSSVAAYFGVPISFSTASFTTAILTTGSPGSSFVGTDLFGVIKADPLVRTPENWGIGESLALFALVMLSFGALVRRGTLRSHLFQGSGRT